MHPKFHVVLGLIFSLILIYFFNIPLISGTIIFLSSFLIDVDHYLYFVYKKKSWSLEKAYHWWNGWHIKLRQIARKQRNEFYRGFAFLHGVEILLLSFLVGHYLFEPFIYIGIGLSFHLFLDLVHQKTIYDRLDKYSIIYDCFKFKKLKFVDELEDLSGLDNLIEKK